MKKKQTLIELQLMGFLQVMGFSPEQVASFVAVVGVLSVVAQVGW